MAQESPRSTRWLLVAAGVVGALLLGMRGFALLDPHASVFEDFYRSLQLFVLEIGDVSAPLPWQLEVARLAAPAMTATSAAVAAISLSRDRVDAWRASRKLGHVVVCGLDERGAAAALALHRAGHDVVAVSRVTSGADSAARRCRGARIPVVLGESSDPLVLGRAGVASAAHLVVLTADLEHAGRVALAATDLPTGREADPLTVHLEISTPELATLLRAVRMTTHGSASWRIEELDLAGVAARTMLDTQPPWPEGVRTAHVVVAGETPLARAVAWEAARRWHHTGQPPAGLTVTRPTPGSHHTTVDSPSAAYVCLDDEAQALATALTLVQAHRDLPVLVRLESAGALGELVHRDSPNLRVISLDESLLTPRVLLDSTSERIARALHDSYRRSTPAGDPSAVAWDELPESLRASNRAQADHVAGKLALVGRVLLPDDGTPPDAFDEDEVDLLGELEHERWVDERRAAGWTSGPRDAVARTTPYLVPWDDLDESVREIDKQFVRALPEILADAGLLLRRVTPSGKRSTHRVHGG
jgi:voltage-gated potassium channel Kch